MAIIITSSKIYDLQNNPIKSNIIHGISGEEGVLPSKQIELSFPTKISILPNYENSKTITVYGKTYNNMRLGAEIVYVDNAYEVKADSNIMYDDLNVIAYLSPESYGNSSEEQPNRLKTEAQEVESFIDDTVFKPNLSLSPEASYEEIDNICVRWLENTYFYITDQKAQSFILHFRYISIIRRFEYNINSPVAFEYFDNNIFCNNYNYIFVYIDYDSKKFTYGIQPIFEISQNELLQTGTTIDNINISQYIYEQITKEWKDGKETATLKLSIGEYYDNKDGTLCISTKKEGLPMTFKIGDIVIPYIPSTTIGKDKPMSLYKDGSPKQFRVTRVKPYYSGACWQEIDLQEIANEAREQ